MATEQANSSSHVPGFRRAIQGSRTLLFFSSAGAESGRTQNSDISPQKRKMESEKDTGEPKEKKTFSMSISKPLGTKPGGGLSVSDSQEKKTFSMNISKSLAKPGSGLAKVPPFGLGSSKQGMSTDVKSTSGKPVPIKMALSSQTKESSVAVKPKSDKIASVFNDDSEEEEMPPEAKMRMRNVGRETPTAAGPNSFGKNFLGFCDRNKIIEREINQQLLEFGDKQN